MLLKVDDAQTIADVQDNFTECFPWLRIEFYRTRHKWKQLNDPEDMIPPETKIGDIRKNHNPGILEIKSWHQTGKVEKDFYKLFGLHVQILRHDGANWVQTGENDILTLMEQKYL